jgi:hypothetical protein
VASIKLLTATAYSASRRFVVNTMKLKPIKKKMVGGSTSRISCSSTRPTRVNNPGALASNE